MGNFNNLFLVRQNANQPIFSLQLFESDGVTPLDLTTASDVKFNMRPEESNVYTITNGNMAIAIPPRGIVDYQQSGSDFAVAGRYLAVVEVDYPINGPLFMPLTGFYHIFITPSL